MTKYLMIFMLLLFGGNGYAQTADLLGALAIDGALTQGEMNGFNNMRQALKRTDFQQDLARLNAEIQTTFFGNYGGISKDTLNFEGFDEVNWNVGSETNSQYYIEFSGLDGATCHLLTNPETRATKTIINDGTGCRQGNNRIKLFY